MSSFPHSQSFPGSTAKCSGSILCSESVRGITTAGGNKNKHQKTIKKYTYISEDCGQTASFISYLIFSSWLWMVLSLGIQTMAASLFDCKSFQGCIRSSINKAPHKCDSTYPKIHCMPKKSQSEGADQLRPSQKHSLGFLGSLGFFCGQFFSVQILSEAFTVV